MLTTFFAARNPRELRSLEDDDAAADSIRRWNVSFVFVAGLKVKKLIPLGEGGIFSSIQTFFDFQTLE